MLSLSMLFLSLTTWLATTTSAIAPIVIGQTTPLTGAAGSYGLSMQAGLSVAIAEANDAGGIRGRNLSLITWDDAYDPQRAIANFKALENQTLLLAGVWGTDVITALYPLILEKRMPAFGLMTGAAIVRTPFHEEFINVRASYNDEIIAHASFLVEYLKVQRVACMYQDDSFGRTGYDSLTAALGSVGMALVASGTYTRSKVDVDAALETILTAAAPAQAVVLVALQAPAIAFIKAFRADHRSDPNCTFLLMSVSYTASFGTSLGITQLGGIYFSQLVPIPTDPISIIGRRFSAVFAKYHPHGPPPDVTAMEGYITGRLIAKVLQGITDGNFTRQAVLDQVYESRLFILDDLTLGVYNRRYEGCDAILCECNAGLRDVFMLALDGKGDLLADPSLPRFRFPITSCQSSLTAIQRPIIFGQLLPASGNEWRALAMEIGHGIMAAFNETNAKGGIGGRNLVLVQYDYDQTVTVNATLQTMTDRYPIVAHIGSVLSHTSQLHSSLPAVGSFVVGDEVTADVFQRGIINVQPTPAMEFMALIDFVVQSKCHPLHFRVPDTIAGQEALNLLLRSIHTYQQKPDSTDVYTTPSSALNDVHDGCVIALGDVSALGMWLDALGTKPDLHLLTRSSTAMALLLNPSLTTQPQSSRLYFPTLTPMSTDGVNGSSMASNYGHLVADALSQVLALSSSAAQTFTTSEDLIHAWYEKGLITVHDTSLGPYNDVTCTDTHFTRCGCNEGAQTLYIDSAYARRKPSPFVYGSADCRPSYTPLKGPLVIILASVLSTLFAILCVTISVICLRWFREMQRMRKQFNNNNVAECCAEAIAKFNFEEVAWLNDIAKPNRIQAAFLQIIRVLQEVKPFIPDQLLLVLLGEAQGEQEVEQGEAVTPVAVRHDAPVRISPNHKNVRDSYCSSTSISTINSSDASHMRSSRKPSSRQACLLASTGKQWVQKRCAFVCIRFGFSSIEEEGLLTVMGDVAAHLVGIGKQHGGTIDRVAFDYVGLHWGLIGTSSEIALRATTAAMKMLEVKMAVPEQYQDSFDLQISVGWGMVTSGTLTAGGHRFFVVGGPEVWLASEIVNSHLPSCVKCALLISPAVHREVQFHVLCYPRVWHNGVLMWQPMCIQQHADNNEWMYELDEMNRKERSAPIAKQLHLVLLMAKNGQPYATIQDEISRLRGDFGTFMTPEDHGSLNYLLATLSKEQTSVNVV